jgi:hypothetical protein
MLVARLAKSSSLSTLSIVPLVAVPHRPDGSSPPASIGSGEKRRVVSLPELHSRVENPSFSE